MVSQVVTGETISLGETAEDRRRDPARARLQPPAGGAVAPAGPSRAANCGEANERLQAAGQPEGRLPQPGEPRGAHADDLDPLVLRDPAADAGPRSASSRERFLRIIHDESMRMTRLLDGILELSVLEGGAQHLDAAADRPRCGAGERRRHLPRAVQLGPAGAGAHAAPSKGACVMADADRLSQVFINLISNAIRYNTSAQPRGAHRQRAARRPLRADGARTTGRHSARGAGAAVLQVLARRRPAPARHAGRRPGPGDQLADHAPPGRHAGTGVRQRGPGACFRLRLPGVANAAAGPADPAALSGTRLDPA